MADDSGPDPRALTRTVATLRPLAIERLAELVTAESPTGDAALIDALGDRLATAYATTGAEVRRVLGAFGHHLICTWSAPNPDRHVLLVGHSDTVLPAGTIEQRPFRVADDGDTVTGPGVYDMKGSLVVVELAMRLLASHGLAKAREVRLVVVNDEEIGSPSGAALVLEEAQGAHAVLGLEPPLPGGSLKVGRRGVARYDLLVDGVEAHAGLDADRGVSAIDELVDQLAQLRTTVPAGPDGSLNVGLLEGGTGANVVAGRARARLGLRFRTPAAERTLLAALEGLRPRRDAASVSLVRLTHRPPWEPDPDNAVAAALIRLGADLGITLCTGVSGGAGDTNATGAAGIPTVDGLGPEGAGAHSASEQASISSLLDRAALLAAYLAT